MHQNKIDKLIINYFQDSLTKEESTVLQEWIGENENNQHYFNEMVEVNYIINSSHEFNNKVSLKQAKYKIARKRTMAMLKYAAVLVVLISTVSYFVLQTKSIEPEITVIDKPITLELENGLSVEVGTEGRQEIANNEGAIIGVQKEGSLTYEKDNTNRKLVYNTLKIPYGKTFLLTLTDGTEVHLNAGSSLRYPVNFLKGENRNVYLEGEAFFNVAKDKAHPFIVNTDQINVMVTGTSFNVSSYKEDTIVNTVLVEGAVSVYNKEQVYNKENSAVLSPGYMASWSKDKQDINTTKVDVENYTGWVEGRLIFRKMPFSSIRKKLERHFNVKIVNKNKDLENNYYNAVFETETIEEVLSSFQKSYQFQFSIKNNIISIN